MTDAAQTGSAVEVAVLLDRIATLASGRGRIMIGIVGPPGSGKSTLARALHDSIADSVTIPMDGFHLASSTIAGSDREHRRGAIDTFDVEGFVWLLERVRRQGRRTLYAPDFRRDLDDPVAGAIAIEPHHRVVIVEGNYLLSREPIWVNVERLLDETWYLDVDDDLRRERLVQRHLLHGRAGVDAEQFANGSDERNAELIAMTRRFADRTVWINSSGEVAWSR